MVRSEVFEHQLTIDPETGLPKLPEGYAWEVRQRGTENKLIVGMRYLHEYPNNWWEDLCRMRAVITWRDVSGVEEHTYATKEDVLKAAVKIYTEYHNQYLQRKDLENLVGLYPPNSIL